jgi:hypothetical protein
MLWPQSTIYRKAGYRETNNARLRTERRESTPEKAIRVLQIYALSILLISTKVNPAAADRILEPSPKKLSFGNLKKLTFKGGNGQYTLNGFVLSKVDSETINLATANKAFRCGSRTSDPLVPNQGIGNLGSKKRNLIPRDLGGP